MRNKLVHLLCFILACGMLHLPVKASSSTSPNSSREEGTSISGTVFVFDADNPYEFSKSNEHESSEATATYGTFHIASNEATLASEGIKDGVAAFSVESGSIAISYIYSDNLLIDLIQMFVHLHSYFH